jgi:hypothetical protein
LRVSLSPQRANAARRGPRLVAVTALFALLFSAFALAYRPIPVHAASNPGNLTLFSVGNRYDGCPLGPAYTFCDQAPGTASQPVPIVVNSSAAVTGVAVSLQPVPGLSASFVAGDFTVSNNTCAGNLVAGAQCEIDVEFSPTATGLRQSQITVTDSAGDSLAINVEGTGAQFAMAPPAPATCTPAVLSDNAYVYCAQPINPPTPTTETFTLSSASGSSGVVVTLAAIPGLESEFASGDFTIETPPCPGTIPAGGNCSIGVAFTPTAAGLRSAALIAMDSSGDRTTVYLEGPVSTGLTFSSAVPGDGQGCGVTDPFLFCSLPVGGVSPTTTLGLVNSSNTQITGLTVPKGSVIAQGATAPDFTVQNTSCTSVLAAGAACNVTVAFTPTTTGLRQGAIVVTDAQGDSTAVNLAGVGDDYNIAPQLPTEVSVIPGGTATFDATLTPDNVLGMNGEQVTFVCPTALPANTSCVVTPCPATITPGMPVSVKVTLVTSSATVVAAVPTGGCSSYGPSLTPSLVVPSGKQSGPSAARGGPFRLSTLYPAILLLAVIGAIVFLVAPFLVPTNTGRRGRSALIFVCAGLAAAILTGCHHHGATISTATPTGVTALTVSGNALDVNGNSLNTSRQFQVTLDVVTK